MYPIFIFSMLSIVLPIVASVLNVTIVSLLPDIPVGLGLGTVGAALDLAIQQANEKYPSHLNITAVKAKHFGRNCGEFDANTGFFMAEQYYWKSGINPCMAMIGSGQCLNLFLTGHAVGEHACPFYRM